MVGGDEGGAGGVAEVEVVVEAVAKVEETLPSFMVLRYPSVEPSPTKRGGGGI